MPFDRDGQPAISDWLTMTTTDMVNAGLRGRKVWGWGDFFRRETKTGRAERGPLLISCA
jgi:hypothetical protein